MNKQKGASIGNTVKLRQCFPEDSDFYYNVKKITLKEYVEKTWGAWDEDFQRKRHKMNFSPEYTQIIQCDGEDIGILVIQEELEVLKIHNIEILPGFQNKGIGAQLLQSIIHRATEKTKNITLQVFKTNPKAKKFYQRLGFKIETENATHFLMKYTLIQM
ncbi:MAG: GNAT family N-acetyltransferase [Promethearchaeota archaeon]